MKKILITGANSYVGTSFENWLSQWPEKYRVDTIDMIDGTWREKSFKGYDVVFHVAGIVHRKETRANAHEYYEINRDLAVETAKKAKQDGVSQFIFMSTMGIYGMLIGVITKDTLPNPKTHYGKSKLQAEEQIRKFSDDSFKVVVLRPPIIYGKNCTGNYAKLSRFVREAWFFPNMNNKRSMLYIDNLSEYVRRIIDSIYSGIYLPQNREYVCTTQLVKEITHIHNKKIKLIKLFNPIIRFLIGRINVISKLFGDCVYERTEDCSYMIQFKDTIKLSEE